VKREREALVHTRPAHRMLSCGCAAAFRF
jgi:hypothetical protein